VLSVTEKFLIDGPAGKLEVALRKPESTPQGIAIIAHPHPLHGGTMENKVVHTLFTTLGGLEFIAVKFNFRGIGKSEGIFDRGVGEVEDAVSVAHAIKRKFNCSPELPLLLAGFSFGGAIQLHAAKKLSPKYLILVAPSVTHLNTPGIPETTQYALIIQGDRDNIVSPDALLSWATPQSQPIVFIPGAEHFFHGKLLIIKDIISKTFRKNIDHSENSA
jgi:alpha/beta superfamily hydrolase